MNASITSTTTVHVALGALGPGIGSISSSTAATSSPRQHSLFTTGAAVIRWNLSVTDDLSLVNHGMVHKVYRMGLITELIGNTITATQEYACTI